MAAPNFERADRLIVHQGDIPGEMRVANQERWYVTRECWQGQQMLDARLLGTFESEQEAQVFADAQSR